MNLQKEHKLVCLVVLDGWGIATPSPGNAISLANTINMNRFMASYPHTQLLAAGEAVGLPRGEAGNTETGHLNLGAGRIVYQDLARINMAIADGSFFKNPILTGAITHAQKNNSNLHLMGLIGAGGVHSNMEHLFALLALAKRASFDRVYLHLFTDGRDSPPTAAATYIQRVRQFSGNGGVGKIASIMGRYWAMDRDLRWDRTAKAYFALTGAVGNLVKTPEEAIQTSYSAGITDEFIEPSIIADSAGKPVAIIKDNDAVVFFNFRIDRPRQLSRAFVFEDFSKANVVPAFDPYKVKYMKSHLKEVEILQKPFDRGKKLENLYFAMMTEYGKFLVENGAKSAFPPEKVDMPLGRVISEANKRQLRVSESEKERFITYYFNGQIENAFGGEERIIVPSPKVATYDLKPEMSAYEICDSVISQLRDDGNFSFVLINFANPDMVGHTGSIGATAKACEVVDDCLGKLFNLLITKDAALLITADHGNAEEKINPHTGQIYTEHTANPVPFIAISRNFIGRTDTLPSGILADVAPTVLALLGLEKPSSMTGRNLLEGI